jgi:tRNA(Ile)-lysidine synthase TilS/MesJ
MAQMGADREKVLVAFSGGADSTALLCLMWDISKNNPTRVYAMHVNHGIRGAEADGDERFCREFCREHGIEFFSTFVDVPTASGGRCDELTARRLRYDALIKKSKRAGLRSRNGSYGV